jgi:hypothetical protein
MIIEYSWACTLFFLYAFVLTLGPQSSWAKSEWF